MKKVLMAAVLLFGATGIFAGTPPEVNAKVLQAFHETFKNPKEVTWNEYDTYYEVNFKQEVDIKTRVQYDMNGNVLQMVRYYSEQELPPLILAKLKKKYKDRSVFGVTEIFFQDNLEYYIKMQDEKHWYTIKSDIYGNSEQTEKFFKAAE
jgi:hypothetical protein